MRKLAYVAAIPMLIVLACGSDRAGPANNPEDTASPAVSSTPTGQSESPTPEPTREPTATPVITPSPTRTADLSCETTAEPQWGGMEWPETEGIFDSAVESVIDAVPEIANEDAPWPEVELHTDFELPADISLDGPVTFTILGSNSYDEATTFDFRKDPGYEFFVLSPGGEIVWRSSDGVDVENSPVSLELEPDEQHEMSAAWDLTGPGGVQIEEGLYVVLGLIYREEPYIQAVDQIAYFGDRPSLDEAFQLRLSAQTEARCGTSIRLMLDVINVSDDLVMVHSGRDFANFFAFVDNGNQEQEEVWNWIQGKGFTDDGVSLHLAPGAKGRITRSWELQNHSGEHIEPGVYELQASIYGRQTGFDGRDQTETAWSNIVEITVVD